MRTIRGKRVEFAAMVLLVFIMGLTGLMAEASERTESVAPAGTLTVYLEQPALDKLGWQVVSRYDLQPVPSNLAPVFAIDVVRSFLAQSSDATSATALRGELATNGSILLMGPGVYTAISAMTLQLSDGKQPTLTSRLDRDSVAPLALRVIQEDLGGRGGQYELIADLVIAEEWAKAQERAELSGRVIGTVVVQIALSSVASVPYEQPMPTAENVSGGVAGVIGPDVIVESVRSTRRWGTFGGVTAYSLTTTACNIGDEVVGWIAGAENHPLIAQNLFRLKDGQFEQVGMSWVKHAFAAATEQCEGNPASCDMQPLGLGCCILPPPPGNTLGINCADTYNNDTNGFQGNLGPRHEVNATTGDFGGWPFETFQDTGNIIYKRLQVDDNDLEPDLNPGAKYFIEAQYVTPDDALAGNHHNSASYRPVTLVENDPGVYEFSGGLGLLTRVSLPAIHAWQEEDPRVTLVNVDIPDTGLEGRVIVGSRAYAIGGGFWRYEYAVHNLNSDRSVGLFDVPVPAGAIVTNVRFHDVDYHSGDANSQVGSFYDGSDWFGINSGGSVTWQTETFAQNDRANAIRWGTLYNFRFDADVCPADGTGMFGIFKPGGVGDPTSMTFALQVPGPLHPPIALTQSDPPNGANDARQPSEPDGGNPTGMDTFELTFNVCAETMSAIEFDVTQDDVGQAPSVDQFAFVDADTIQIVLDGPIGVGVRTTIAHISNGAGTTVGFLPVDVNGDDTSSPSDLVALIAALDGSSPLPAYSTDMDRNGAIEPADLIRALDLLNGAENYDSYFGAQLP